MPVRKSVLVVICAALVVGVFGVLGVWAQEPPEPPDDPELFFSGPVIGDAGFCWDRSLGGQRTYAYDSDGDAVADICSLPYSRWEAVVRQLALERLASRQFGRFAEIFAEECHNVAATYGDPGDEAADDCAGYRAGARRPPGSPPLVPPFALNPGVFYSSPAIDGRHFCANLSFDGPRLYAFDSDGDGVADECSLYGSKRATVARQFAMERIAEEQPALFSQLLHQECRAAAWQHPQPPSSDPAVACGEPPPTPLPAILLTRAPGTTTTPPATPTATPTATVPGTPGAPTLTAGDGQLSASWTAPSSDGGSAITSYRLQRRVVNSNGDCAGAYVNAGSPTGTSHTISDLANGTTYCISVTAVNAVGASPRSSETRGTPSAATTTPGKPGTPTLTAGNKTLSVSWTAPSSDGGSTITGYKLQRRGVNNDGDCSGSHTNAGSPTGTSHTISGLTNDTIYCVSVAAVNSVGTGPWSDEAKGTPAATVPGKPGTPVITAGNAQLSATWTAPSSNGGSAVTGYVLRYREVDGNDDCTGTHTILTVSFSSNSASNITGTFTNGTTYCISVAAVNSVGRGDWSDEAKGTPAATATAPGKPGTPTLTAGDGQLSASWTAPSSNGGSAITGYKLRHRGVTNNACSGSYTTLSGTPSGTSRTITGLTNGTAYCVSVAAVNAVGDSDWSDEAKGTPAAAATAPAKPGAPTLTPGDGKLTVSWTAPSDGGSAITGYKLRHVGVDNNNDCSGTYTVLPKTFTGTTGDITGLTNGTTICVGVAAVNDVGQGPWSDVTKGTAATTPGKPGTPTLTAGNGELTVSSWTAPSSNGGSAITGYKTSHRGVDSDGNCAGGFTESGGFTGTSRTITGLTNGTTYCVSVAAFNAIGTGPWSDEAKGTPSANAGKPGPPRNAKVDLDEVNTTKVTVTVDAPANDGGSAITGYTCVLDPPATAENKPFPCRMGDPTKGTSITMFLPQGESTLRIWALNANTPGANSRQDHDYLDVTFTR